MPGQLNQIRYFNRIPLRLFLTLPFLIEMFVIVGVVGWLSVRNGQQAVNRATSKLRQETTARINTEVSDLLSTSQKINQLTVQAIDQENLDISNVLVLEELYWRYLKAFYEVKGLGVGNRAGDIMGMFQRNEREGMQYFLEYETPETQDLYISNQLDAEGQIVQTTTTEQDLDARERPWYQAAIQANGPVWTDVYPSVSKVEGHTLAINASRPVKDAQGDLQGVVSVIVDLGQISEFLESIEFSPSGQIYIFELNGNLIGSADGRNPVAVNGDSAKRLPAVESQEPIIQASAAYLQKVTDNFTQIDQPLQFDVDLLDEKYFLQVTPLRASNQLEWFIVVVAPESDFLAEINAQRRLTFVFCLVAFLVSGGLSYLTSLWVVHPLNRLNQAVRSVAQGDLFQTVQAEHITEVRDLSDSFNQMARTLQTLFGQLSSLNQELVQSESRLKQFLEALPIGVVVHDAKGQLQYLNQVGRSLLPRHPLQQPVQPTAETTESVVDLEAALFDALPIGQTLTGATVRTDDVEILVDGRLINLDIVATPILSDQAEVTYVITAFQDITARKRAERQLLHNALHDTLTGLPNRAMLNQRLDMALQSAQRTEAVSLALLFLDLDRFKIINDSLGHWVGDQLLIKIAEILDEIVRPNDIVARLGGDEYVVWLEAIAHPQEAIAVAERILDALQTPLVLDNHAVVITASIGMILDTSGYRHASELLRDADTAMYQAKAKGKARYEIFTPDMRSAATQRLHLENDLRHAIERDELYLVYQPIVSLETGLIVGCEGLMRWHHRNLGHILPSEFIPIAEDSGVIVALSTWVLRKACQQLAAWAMAVAPQSLPKLSINLSANDLTAVLPMTLSETLAETGASASSLNLEITESVLIYHVTETIAVLENLRELGVSLSIDDFGTGYSSLNYLHRLPVDSLKIDQSFIQAMNLRGQNYRIVETIIALSNQLQIEAIAEGIETVAQLNDLKALGCELGQGYYFSRPLTAAKFLELLTSAKQHLP
ncbi:MAG: EAL domain-containing protein [Leptolyngbya sp. SIOISBB]|nr:EAL domain-containing protein [Leptolyngbya sp. SIOISBB]